MLQRDAVEDVETVGIELLVGRDPVARTVGARIQRQAFGLAAEHARAQVALAVAAVVAVDADLARLGLDVFLRDQQAIVQGIADDRFDPAHRAGFGRIAELALQPCRLDAVRAEIRTFTHDPAFLSDDLTMIVMKVKDETTTSQTTAPQTTQS